MKGKDESLWNEYAGDRHGKITRNICCLAVLLLCSATTVFTQAAIGASDDGSGSRPRQYMLGDWGGKRTSLASKGVTFDFFYVADLQANPVGGREQTQAGWGRIRGTMDGDFGKLTDWNGLTFHATRLWQFGPNFRVKIGTIANPIGLLSPQATRLDSLC